MYREFRAEHLGGSDWEVLEFDSESFGDGSMVVSVNSASRSVQVSINGCLGDTRLGRETTASPTLSFKDWVHYGLASRCTLSDLGRDEVAMGPLSEA